jgi:hypothetical protein
MKLHFSKMHGLGNDFVVIDAIRQQVELTPARVRFLADRHFGVGCDQLLVVERAQAARRRFPLSHLQCGWRRGGTVRQRRALFRALRARPGPDRPARNPRRDHVGRHYADRRKTTAT